MPNDTAPRYLIFDRAASFNEEVVNTLKALGVEPKQTSFCSPWQNGVAERFVGNCRDVGCRVMLIPRLGGLHHRYRLAA